MPQFVRRGPGAALNMGGICLLEMPQSEIDIRERSPLALAFLGDSVLELLVRGQLVAHSRLSPGALHREAAQVVSAKGQWDALPALEPLLTPEEAAVLRRGRNASKASVSKHATPQQYKASTGLEAVFGWLYLQNKHQRIWQLFECIWQYHLGKAQGGDTSG